MCKKLFYPIFAALLFSSVTGCNSKTDTEYEYTQSSSVIVSAFSLKDNKKVLDSLQNVFFSIDLENARIFNADSLPYGTKVNRLQVNITTASYASEVNLTYFCPELGRDSVVNFLTNPSDSIDFSAGPVKLSVKSQSGSVTLDYEIKVNVHKIKADSLAWYSMQTAQLPSSFAKIDSQRTVQYKGAFYTLSSSAGAYCVSHTSDPSTGVWQTADVNFGFTPDVNSLSATDDALFILADDGTLHTSTDFTTWTSTGVKWNHIYGGYNGKLIGCAENSGWYEIRTYPGDSAVRAPEDFPVEGTSQLVTFTLPMGENAMAVMVGGKLADGSLTAETWGFDGNVWAKVSSRPVKVPLRDMSLVSYALIDVPSSTWTPTEYPVLLALGGRTAIDAVNRTVYYSRDLGMTWKVAPDLVQLPKEVPPYYGATAYVYTSVMSVGSRSAYWSELPVRSLMPGAEWLGAGALSRAVYPVTEWRCPAIYSFGGYSPDGDALGAIWRGVVLQYTLKPVE